MLGVCLLAVAVFFAGCSAKVPRTQILPSDRSYSAELKGTLFAVSFAAQLDVEPEKGGVRAFSLRFLRSQSGIPEGLTLSGFCGAEGLSDQSITARLGEVCVEVDPAVLQTLLLPVTVLVCRNDYTAIQKNESGFLLRYPDGTTLTLSPDFLPLHYSSFACDLDILSIPS